MEKGDVGVGSCCDSCQGFDGLFDREKERSEDEKSGNFEPVDGDDVGEQLPDDPFGMGICSGMMAVRTCWFEDSSKDTSGYHYKNDCSDCQSKAAAVTAPSEFMLSSTKFGNCVEEKPSELPVHSSEIGLSTLALDAKYELLETDRFGEIWAVNLQSDEQKDHYTTYFSQGEGLIFVMGMAEDHPCTGEDAAANHLAVKENEDEDEDGVSSSAGEQPHDGLLLALQYLGVHDLLSIETVCKALHSEVRTDPLLWRTIHINQPYCYKLTDDALYGLAQRAQGILKCLNLAGCMRITDAGLKHVLESNPIITKLNVRGCVRLTAAGLLDSLKLFKSPGKPGIKHLKISGLNGLTLQHYEEMKLLLGMDRFQQPNTRKPHFYSDLSFSSCDYDSAIDVEVCPKCQNLRLVYDCPAEGCRGENLEPCRGCILCIPRCIQCGRCIKDGEYEENIYLDLICLPCWESIIMYQENQEVKAGSNTIVAMFL